MAKKKRKTTKKKRGIIDMELAEKRKEIKRKALDRASKLKGGWKKRREKAVEYYVKETGVKSRNFIHIFDNVLHEKAEWKRKFFPSR